MKINIDAYFPDVLREEKCTAKDLAYILREVYDDQFLSNVFEIIQKLKKEKPHPKNDG